MQQGPKAFFWKGEGNKRTLWQALRSKLRFLGDYFGTFVAKKTNLFHSISPCPPDPSFLFFQGFN